MYFIPVPIIEIIIAWTLEFHRADANERMEQFRTYYHTIHKSVCEDIRMNTPVYTFFIQAQSRTIHVNLFLPNCDPYRVRPHQIPESHIQGYKRRSLGLRPYSN
jgi:hypothetical protein